MSNEQLQSLIGSWTGSCKTWFEPNVLADEAEISGKIEPMFDGKFVRHIYESTIRGKPRQGEETLAFNSVAKRFQSVWFDSFHMNYALQISQGEAVANGFHVTGHYDVGPKEQPWSWRTEYELIDADHLTITAYNISPEGEEAKAVETVYVRIGG